jgi:hypothetical protein
VFIACLTGIWAIYCTIRYSLAFQTAFTGNIPIRTLALVLCVVSGVGVAEVVVTLLIPLLPEDEDGFIRAVRMVLRGRFVVLIFATAIVNLVFVLICGGPWIDVGGIWMFRGRQQLRSLGIRQ